MKKFYLLAISLLLFNSAFAQLILKEDFDYGTSPISNITATGNWTQTPGGTANPIPYNPTGLSFANYSASGIGGSINILNTGYDINRNLPTTVTSGNVYMAAIVKLSVVPNSVGDYFMHLADWGTTAMGTNLRGRVYARQGSTSTKVVFGVSKGTLPGAVFSTTEYDLNTEYVVVMKYTINLGAANDACALYITSGSFPSTEPTSSALTATDVSQSDLNGVSFVAIRQGGGSGANSGNINIDGLMITQSWADLYNGSAVALSSASSITGFTLQGGYIGTIAGSTINITIPYGTNLAALTATGTISALATVNPSFGSVLNYGTPQSFTVTAQNMSTTGVYTTNITTLAGSNANSITGFAIFGQSGSTTILGNSIFINMPSGTNVSALTLSGVSISPLASISPNTLLAQNFSGLVNYTVTSQIGGTNIYVVTVTILTGLSNENTITGFTIPNQVGNTTILGTTIGIAMPYGTTVTGLVPTISVSPVASITGSGVATDFTNPVMYTVTAQFGNLRMYSVVVTNLPGSSANSITGFRIANQVGSTTISGFNILVNVPFGTTLTGITPTITVSALATVNPTVATPKDFSTSVVYTVTSQNMAMAYYTVSVTSLPQVTILGLALPFIEDFSSTISLTQFTNWTRARTDGTPITTANIATFVPISNSISDTYPGATGGNSMIISNGTISGTNEYICSTAGFNTLNYVSLNVNYGFRRTATFNDNGSSTGVAMYPILEWSTNATSWTSVTGTNALGGVSSPNPIWSLASPTGFDLPSGALNQPIVYFRFRITTSSVGGGNFRIDDFKITGNSTTDNSIFSFNVLNTPGIISGNTINVAVPVGSTLTNLSASGVLGSTLAGVNPLFATVRDYSVPVNFTVTSQAMTTRVYTVIVTATGFVLNGITPLGYVRNSISATTGLTTIPSTLTFTIAGQIVGKNVAGNTALAGGGQFSLIDATGATTVRIPATLFAAITPTVIEGMNMTLAGVLGQNNGLSQFTVSSVVSLDPSIKPRPTPILVTNLNENIESQLIKVVAQMDSTQWKIIAGQGYNAVSTINGVVYTVRIYRDLTEMYGKNFTTLFGNTEKVKTFTLTGLGGQFSSTAPFNTGYQIIPYQLSDFVTPSQANIQSITGFSIAGQLSSTIVGNNISVLMPTGTSITALGAAFSVTGFASVSPVLGALVDYTNPVNYTVTAISGAVSVYTVTVTKPYVPNTEANIISFTYLPQPANGLTTTVTGSISGANITVELPANVTLTGLVPTIVISPKATINPVSGVAPGYFDVDDFTKQVSYTVTAEDGLNKPLYQVLISILRTTSIANSLEVSGSSLTIYPNPSTGWVKVAGKEAASIAIYNLIGVKIAQKDFTKGNTEFTGLTSGVYFVKTSSGAIKKLVVE